MVLDKFVEKEINGKPYKFCFTVKMVFMAERNLASKKLLQCISDLPMSTEDHFTLFKYALMGGNNGVKEAEIEDLWLDAIDQLTYAGVFEIIITALQKSGVIGRVKNTEAPAE